MEDCHTARLTELWLVFVEVAGTGWYFPTLCDLLFSPSGSTRHQICNDPDLTSCISRSLSYQALPCWYNNTSQLIANIIQIFITPASLTDLLTTTDES